ncbi:MAG TPA: PfkB family carbohydrate kinase [Streptosporangiaceae bacterium]
MSGEVIMAVTLNPALRASYTAGGLSSDGINPVSRPAYRAGGRGITVARVLQAFGHDAVIAGLAGGAGGELIKEDLARTGVATAFTQILGEPRRIHDFAGPDGQILRFGEPGPYITTEELGRFAADYRRLVIGAAAVVLSGSLPDGLPAETYGTLVTYAADAGVPVFLDAGGEELLHAATHKPDLVLADDRRVRGDASLGSTLIRLGAGAAVVAETRDDLVRVITEGQEWIADVTAADVNVTTVSARGALMAGVVPGHLLGWSWPDRLRHALALAAVWDAETEGSDQFDKTAYEQLLTKVSVKAAA